MSNKIIAVDFDGTLCEDKWPTIGDPNLDLIRYLIDQQKSGARLILRRLSVGADCLVWRLMLLMKIFRKQFINMVQIQERYLPMCILMIGHGLGYKRMIFSDHFCFEIWSRDHF